MHRQKIAGVQSRKVHWHGPGARVGPGLVPAPASLQSGSLCSLKRREPGNLGIWGCSLLLQAGHRGGGGDTAIMVRPAALFHPDLRLSSCRWNHPANPKIPTLPYSSGACLLAIFAGSGDQPSTSAISSGVSRQSPASMTPSTCLALRAPTIAPVTTGRRNVHAIAACPGVRPCR